MNSRSSAEAVAAYRSSLQRIVSCVTPDVLLVRSASQASPYEPNDRPHLLELGDSTGVWLRAVPQIRLIVLQMYEIAQQQNHGATWSVQVAAYIHSLSLRGSGEIVAYHWHPTGDGSITTPHLHVGPSIAGTSLLFGNRYAHRIHFPTGIVSLASIVRLAIDEFGARPLRDDWRQVLAEESTI